MCGVIHHATGIHEQCKLHIRQGHGFLERKEASSVAKEPVRHGRDAGKLERLQLSDAFRRVLPVPIPNLAIAQHDDSGLLGICAMKTGKPQSQPTATHHMQIDKEYNKALFGCHGDEHLGTPSDPFASPPIHVSRQEFRVPVRCRCAQKQAYEVVTRTQNFAHPHIGFRGFIVRGLVCRV